jgi:phage gpG-like protein
MISGFAIEWQVGNVPSGEDTLERVAVAFERLGDELVDFGTHVFPKLVPVLERAVEGQFDAEGKGPHGSWAPLSDSYEQVKQVRWPGRPLLVASGKLKEALTSSSSPFAKRVIAKDSFDFGTLGVEYASFHQTGTLQMPDRPPFDFDSDFEGEVTEAAKDGVREAMKASGANEFATEGP